MWYSKEGPNVQSQDEHRAYVNMMKIKTSKFASKEEKLNAENKWLKEKMKTQARENGGWYNDEE